MLETKDVEKGRTYAVNLFTKDAPKEIKTIDLQVGLPVDLHQNGGKGRVQPEHGGEHIPSNAWAGWHGKFGSPLFLVSASGLHTCVGLVIAARKPSLFEFDDVLVFHFGGTTESWNKALKTAPKKIETVVGKWSGPGLRELYLVAAAGPQHPGTRDEFEGDYKTLVKSIASLGLKRQVLFWTTDEKYERVAKGEDPDKSPMSGARVLLHKDGKGIAVHTPE